MERIHGARSQGAVPLTSQCHWPAAWIRANTFGACSQGGEWGLSIGRCWQIFRSHSLIGSVCNGPATPQSQPRLRLFAWRYIPVIGFCAPVIEEMNARALRIRIPLGWRTRNHLGSMYFGRSPPAPIW